MAAGALLIDYVLTVAVSIAAGVAAVTSAFPQWHVNRVEWCLGFLALIAVGNLRGVRESGRIFAVPTYFFLAMMLGLIAAGMWRWATGDIVSDPTEGAPVHAGTTALTAFLVLRAFANGCTAMTGVEAVSNGVPAFRPPEAKNAAATLLAMAGLAVTLFVGITLLAQAYHVMPREDETVVSQLARSIFGGRGVPYYLVQGATMLILVLAANTAYSDFPAPRLHRGPRQVPAPAVHEPGRPAGLLERHRGVERAGRACSWSRSGATPTPSFPST